MANKYLIISVLCAVMLKGAAFAGPIPPAPSGNYVNNSASAQSAQFNVTSGTVRGALTAGSLVIPAISVATATATQHIGGGYYLTNLNASQVLTGTIPAPVVWHGAPIGTQYGGSGLDWSGIAQGRIPYFSGTGVMGTVPAGVANQVLQAGGPAGSPSFTGAPTVLGTNVTAIPPANLAAGTLPVNVPASSITASGVTPGVYGGPTQAPQLTITSDGRVTSAVQYPIPGVSSTTVMYDKSYTWTKYQNFLSSVTLPIIDGPTILTDNLTVSASVQANIAQLNSVDFVPVTAPAYREGRIFYDNNAKTLVVYSDTPATSLNVGEEMWTVARNNTVAIIPDGSVVYITGAVGQMPTIALARADSFATSRLIGVTTMDFPINGNGKVTVFGKVHDLNTTGLTEGNVLYLSTFTAGALSLTRPSAPNYDARVGLVLREHGTDGEIYINPDMSIRLGLGAPNQLLGMNSAGTEEQYKTLRSTNISVSNSAGFIDLAVVSVPTTAVDLSTVTSALAIKFDKAGGTLTGDITINANNKLYFPRGADQSPTAYIYNSVTGSSGSNLEIKGDGSGAGVITLTPGASVNVVGAANVSGALAATGGTFSVANTSFSVVAGKTGIGTASPSALLHIVAPVTTAAPGYNVMRFRNTGNLTYGFDAYLEGLATGDFEFGRTVNSVFSPMLHFVNSNGYIGIGTGAPTSQLDISGQGWNDGYARGVYSTNYSGATLSSGTVLTMSANYAYSIGFTTNPANGAYAVGTLYDTSCAAAAVCRVCTEGICPVKLDTGASCTTTNTAVITGAQGTAVCTNAPDAATTHWQEIGQPASFNAAATGGTILIWAHRN